MGSNSYKAVLFDMDDTLYPYIQYVSGGIASVSRYLHAVYGIDTLEIPIKKEGLGWEEILDSLCRMKLNSMDIRLAYRLKHVFLTHIPQLKLFHEAEVVLAYLRRANIMTGVFAPGPAHAQRMKARALRLNDLCDAIMYPEDLVGHDALADAVMMLCMDFEVPLDNIIIVGNMSYTDFRPFRDTNATLLAISHPSPSQNSELLAGRNRITRIDSLMELPDILTRKPPLAQDIPEKK